MKRKLEGNPFGFKKQKTNPPANKKASPWEDLPTELWREIHTFMDGASKLSFSLVSTSFNRVFLSSNFATTSQFMRCVMPDDFRKPRLKAALRICKGICTGEKFAEKVDITYKKCE